MKLAIGLITFLSFSAQAQIYFKSIPVCTSWNYTNGGYMCSSYPMSDAIPDQYSLNNKIRDLETRIQILEKKLPAAE